MDLRIEGMTFGVELELHLPRELTRLQAADRVSAAIGKPVNCEGYNHHDGNYWKVVQDGSLNSVPNSWEFVSPIMKGEEGLAELKIVMDTLTALGATVSVKCGTHIHVGVGRNPDVSFLKRLFKTYVAFEPAIDTVIQESRRGNSGYMTSSLIPISQARVDAAQSWRDLLSLSIFPHDRFYKVNMAHAILRHGTIEFRHHGGTLEFPKIRMWILFCLRMIATAQDGRIAATSATPQRQFNRARRGTKAYRIGEMLLRPEGCTAQEAMAAVGWLKISMVAQARICGLTLMQDRMGRNIRFYAQATSTQSSAITVNGPTTLSNLLNVIGASIEEQQFFANRAAQFAARERRAA